MVSLVKNKGSHGQCGWEIDTDFAIVHGVMEKKRSDGLTRVVYY
jgi:hypothetical protein